MSTKSVGRDVAELVWSLTSLLRGTHRPHDYTNVLLPLLVLGRVDAALADTNGAVLAADADLSKGAADREPTLRDASGHFFYNTSPMTLGRIVDAGEDVATNLIAYIRAFSPNVRDVLDMFGFTHEIEVLARAGALHPILSRLTHVHLHPERVPDRAMGSVVDELVRQAAEHPTSAAGHHLTPPDVLGLMVDLLFARDSDGLRQPGEALSLYDPAVGTGGVVHAAEDALGGRGVSRSMQLYGQDIHRETAAVARARLLLTGRDPSTVVLGNSLTEDAFSGSSFDYCLAVPPWGLNWNAYAEPIEREHVELGSDGRFGPGLPAKSDGQLLFLLHMLAKLKPYDGASGDSGGRLAIVTNHAPLSSGRHGESQIRRHVIDNDMLDAVIALPDQLFYNTSISTFLWILTNRKASEDSGTVQVIDGRDLWGKPRSTMGDKRKVLTRSDVTEIVDAHVRRDRSQISRLLGIDEFTASSDKWSIEPWMFMPSVTDESHRPLGDYVEIAPSVQPPYDEGAKVLEITPEGDITVVDLEDLGRSPSRLFRCQVGDIIQRGSRWVSVPDGTPRGLARLPPLRPRNPIEGQSELLALWLSSPEAQLQSVTTRGRPNLKVRVPSGYLENTALGAATARLVRVEREARHFVQRLLDSPLGSDAHGGDVARIEISEVGQQAARLNAMIDLLQPMTDPFRRAEWAYPTQIAELARRWRVEDRGLETRARTAELIGEAVARHLGVLAAAATLAKGTSDEADLLSHFRGGIAAGAWLRLLQDAQNNGAVDAMPVLADVSFKKRGAGALVDAAVHLRNRRAHAHGPYDDYQLTEHVEELERVVGGALNELSWFGSLQLVYVQRCEYLSSGAAVASGLLLRGAHPAYEHIRLPVTEPLRPSRTYALDGRAAEPLALGPLLTVQRCDQCRREETYVLERQQPNGDLKARSLRDHEIVVSP